MFLLCTYDEVYLVEKVNNQIVGSKLPSIKQGLSVLFYNLRHVKFNLRKNARLVFKEIVLLWQKARIPVQDEQHCILSLKKLYQNLRELQKSAKRVSEKNTKNVNEFKEKLNDLFDVSHSNALNMMKIEEDKKFLLM